MKQHNKTGVYYFTTVFTKCVKTIVKKLTLIMPMGNWLPICLHCRSLRILLLHLLSEILMLIDLNKFLIQNFISYNLIKLYFNKILG